MSDKQAVLDNLQIVEDPELEISVVELGLVYDVRFEQRDGGTHAEIDLTLTSPGCPVAPEIMAAVHRAALSTDGVDSVHVNLVWTPRWDPRKHATEDALMDMGLF
ncbi:MAG: metal-sulfur cluster assembly factor [Candidatus Thermoplasmatota archaeon]|nr:metal-sulfur cluster assembly factor [Candidatus Thermoplasmatota archaeon]